MRVVNQMIGALIEAWGEVKVQKARVVLSLVGVVAAVAAMSTVIAMGNVMKQSLTEIQESMEGRTITLNINVNKKADDSALDGAVGDEPNGFGSAAFTGRGDPTGVMFGGAVEAQKAQNDTPGVAKEDAKGRPVDPVGDAMVTVAERFKIPYWSRKVDVPGVEFREFIEAQSQGMFRGKPVEFDEFTSFIPPLLKAVDPNYSVIYRLRLEQGRWLHEDDWQQRVAPVVINGTMWRNLGEPDLREPLVLHANDDSGRQFRVVGVMKAKSRFDAPEVYISYESWRYMNTGDAGFQNSPTLLVWVGESQVNNARRAIPAAVAGVLGPQWEGMAHGGEGFDFGQSQVEQTNSVIMMIGAIVIFLGALGLLNVAIVTVRQRIREIGIRRAMGASAVRVFFAVFMESVVATFVAGVLGVAIAIAIFRYLPFEDMGIYIQEMPSFPMNAALVGVAISTSIGALCGIIPAFAAVRVKPIDAIRY